jgi:hypothetical protein
LFTSDFKLIPGALWHAPINAGTQKETGRERVLRPQTELGGGAAGGSRRARRAPHQQPGRFTANDAAADERTRHIELHRERVILRRAVQGMRIALNVPVQAFRGVSIRLTEGEGETSAGVAVFLEHVDPALSIELYSAENSDDVVAEWQLWSRVLGVPMLLKGADGELRRPFPHIGAVRCKAPAARRRRRAALHRRRPKFLVRRRPGVTRAQALVHQGEREIIARN